MDMFRYKEGLYFHVSVTTIMDWSKWILRHRKSAVHRQSAKSRVIVSQWLITEELGEYLSGEKNNCCIFWQAASH